MRNPQHSIGNDLGPYVRILASSPCSHALRKWACDGSELKWRQAPLPNSDPTARPKCKIETSPAHRHYPKASKPSSATAGGLDPDD